MSQNIPAGKSTFVDINGKPLAGGFVFNYLVGTTTPNTTYQDYLLTIPNTNPIVLDARGQCSMYGVGPFRQIVQDSTGVQIWDQVVLDAGNAATTAMASLQSSSLTQGVSLVTGAARVVDSIATVRTLPKTGSPRVQVTGYTAPSSGGGSDFYYDPSDTTSADNGGTIIVAGDGGRWKMEPNKSSYSIQQFGGGESVSDNLAALNAAKAALPSGAVLEFPKFSTGTYAFPTGFPDFGTLVLNPARGGITISGPSTPGLFYSTIATMQDVTIHLTDLNYNYVLRANFWTGIKGAEKQLWLSEGDVKDTKPVAINCGTQLIFKQVLLGVADAFSTFTPAGAGVSNLFIQPPPVGNCQLGCYPIRSGQELTAGMNTGPDNAGEIAAGAIWSTGYAILRGTPSAGDWTLTTKYQTVGAVAVTVTPVSTGTPGYNPTQPLMSVRFLSEIRFQILMSGVVIVDQQITSGYLMLAGLGATTIFVTTNVNITGWYLRTFSSASSPRLRTLGMVGDSLTADIHGGWAYWCANALDASLGIKIAGIENRAISGQTTAQQLTNLSTNPFVNASDVVVFLGTNDIQGANNLAAFQASYQSLLTLLQSRGGNIILVIPPLWYTQTQSGGKGTASVRAEFGADIRAAIGRFAADYGFQLVDATQLSGVIDAVFLTSSFADPILRDNIHETSYFNKFLGNEIAKAVASAVCPKVAPIGVWTPLISTVYSGGYSGTLAYRINNGDVELRGNVSQAGSIADGTVVATLQEFLRPGQARGAIIIGASNAQAGSVVIGANGTLTVKGVSASNSLTFDGIRYTP